MSFPAQTIPSFYDSLIQFGHEAGETHGEVTVTGKISSPALSKS